MKIILIIHLFISSAFALDEKELIHSVLKNFPLIQEAELKNEAAQGEFVSAEGAFDYKLSFKSRNRIEEKYDNNYFESSIERQTSLGGLALIAGHRQGIGHFPAYDGKYFTSGGGEIFAGITQPLLRNFKTDESRTNLKIKQIEKKQSEIQLEIKKMTSLHKALSLYYKWVLETKKLKINQEVLDLALTRHSMLEKKFKAGDIEKLKIIDNQRSIEKRQSEVVKNKIELQKIKTQLSVYLRDEEGNPLSLPEEPRPDMILLKEEMTKNQIDSANIPQIHFLQLEREKLKLKADFYDQSQLPGLNLEILGSRELSQNTPYDPEVLQVGVKFDLPLENRKAEGKTVASEYKLKAIEKNKMYVESKFIQEFNFFTDAYLESRKRFEISSKEYEHTLKMANAEKSRWSQGASDLFIVNIREQDLADVEIRRWTALYDYHQYYLDAQLFSGNILKFKSL